MKTTSFLLTVAAAALSLSQFPLEGLLKSKRVDAYEVGPGTLAFPRYGPNGKVCEVLLEKIPYSEGRIRGDVTLKKTEVDEIANKLVPANQRGRKSNLTTNTVISGSAMTTMEDFDNVSIQLFTEIDPRLISDSGPVPAMTNPEVKGYAALITWKPSSCPQGNLGAGHMFP